MQMFKGEYSSHLNSSDLYDPSLPLSHSTAHGGTMILWKTEHDPFVKLVPVGCSAFQPIIFKPPGHALSIQVAVYLPTQGKENEFVNSIAKLSLCLDQLSEQHPEAVFCLRGDFNVNEKNKRRQALLKHLCTEHALKITPFLHRTYHHFLGGGNSDSFLDKILYSSSLPSPEVLLKIFCKLEDPLINSHHDLILSTWKLP